MSDTFDPFKSSDQTIIRPRPGAGRRPSPDATMVPAGGAVSGSGSGGRAPRAAASPPADDDAERPDAGAGRLGLNPLVQAASPLLLLAGQLRGAVATPDVTALRQQVLDEIRKFEARTRVLQIGTDVALAARYTLCACLDEAVLSTHWGEHSVWSQQTLLVTLHREAWGGEKFFDMLEKIAEDPARHIDLMELQYVCLALGFAGKYRARERGEAQLLDVQRRLYQQIKDQRGVPEPALSLRWEGEKDRRHALVRYVPWWVVGAGALAVLTMAWLLYSVLLTRAASPVKAALAGVRADAFMTGTAAVPVDAPTLRSLLLADEQSGAVVIAEKGSTTTVRLPGSDLFASGKAEVSERYRALLGRIGAAIEQVPGRVLVEGHTDDQPLRSADFADNFDLSRARARSVAAILSARVNDPSRLRVNGRGAEQPLDPGNRALNRRVEILHVRGS